MVSFVYFKNIFYSMMFIFYRIVSVGGDGMFSECVNGLLARLQSDSEIDMNDPDSEIVASKIPIGIVPAGNVVQQL
jgi:diacylglycerol kinase family enzyme